MVISPSPCPLPASTALALRSARMRGALEPGGLFRKLSKGLREAPCGLAPAKKVTGKGQRAARVQVKSGEELRPFFGQTLMPSILDKAFKGEL